MADSLSGKVCVSVCASLVISQLSGAYLFSRERPAKPPGTQPPDRFGAKCRRVLHSAIIVEIYVANISRRPLPPPHLRLFSRSPGVRTCSFGLQSPAVGSARKCTRADTLRRHISSVNETNALIIAAAFGYSSEK